jgi:phosphosulfolactate synthase
MEALDNKRAFDFIDILPRSEKPRRQGLVMMLDKGLGLHLAKDMTAAAQFIDIVKLGWATPRLFPEAFIREKIRLYRDSGIMVGNGGTLLEIACQQGKVEQFLGYCSDIGLELIEVSNGVVPIPPAEKAGIIRKACSMGFSVISEIGKKEPAEDRRLSRPDRVAEARRDLDAGAQYVIIEAREGGRNLGVYDESGGLKEDMARYLAEEIGIENIMFEAPEKSQQAELVLLFGRDVNLGNIRPEDVTSLETLRRGIRGDTFGKVPHSDRPWPVS